jgi:hypothetical protein
MVSPVGEPNLVVCKELVKVVQAPGVHRITARPATRAMEGVAPATRAKRVAHYHSPELVKGHLIVARVYDQLIVFDLRMQDPLLGTDGAISLNQGIDGFLLADFKLHPPAVTAASVYEHYRLHASYLSQI